MKKVEIVDSWSNKMYIERVAAHPVFSMKSLIRLDTQFDPFIDEILD